jgi:hypothetical protein
VCDAELEAASSVPLVWFYRRDELHGDPSNWFAPTVGALVEWCASSGLDPTVVDAWPKDAPERCMLRLTRSKGSPEFDRLSLRAAARTAFVQAPSNGSGEAATLMNLMQATARAAAA